MSGMEKPIGGSIFIKETNILDKGTKIALIRRNVEMVFQLFNYSPVFPLGQSRVSSCRRVEENYIQEMDAYLHYGLTYVLQLTL